MRKIIMMVIAVITAIIGIFQSNLGITLGATAAFGALGVIVIYIFLEGKNDIKRAQELIIQSGKYKDPSFWMAIIAGLLPEINQIFELNLPIEIIMTIIGVLITILLKKAKKEIKAPDINHLISKNL